MEVCSEMVISRKGRILFLATMTTFINHNAPPIKCHNVHGQHGANAECIAGGMRHRLRGWGCKRMFGMLKLPFPLNGEQRLGKLIAISNLAVLHLFRYQIFQDLLSFSFKLFCLQCNRVESS